MSFDPQEWIVECWRELRNGADKVAMARMEGRLSALEAAGLLTTAEANIWRRVITVCPGHHDEWGRVWCAYCGTLVPDEAQEAPTRPC